MTPSDMIYGFNFLRYILTICQLKEVRLHPTVRLLTRQSNTDDPNKTEMKLRAAIESLMSSGQGLRWGRTYLEAAAATGQTFRITVSIADILIH
jgi:hypothetical protein